jgi:small nuclear ribonucleoprotein (snRNP)-like protein
MGMPLALRGGRRGIDKLRKATGRVRSVDTWMNNHVENIIEQTNNEEKQYR